MISDILDNCVIFLLGIYFIKTVLMCGSVVKYNTPMNILPVVSDEANAIKNKKWSNAVTKINPISSTKPINRITK